VEIAVMTDLWRLTTPGAEHQFDVFDHYNMPKRSFGRAMPDSRAGRFESLGAAARRRVALEPMV